jgi:hypothetical protein
VRAPAEVVLRQAGVRQIERVYNITVPQKPSQYVLSMTNHVNGASPALPSLACLRSEADAADRLNRLSAAGHWSALPLAERARVHVCRPLTATHMLAALASARGWTTGAGLPDEARAGRQVAALSMLSSDEHVVPAPCPDAETAPCQTCQTDLDACSRC